MAKAAGVVAVDTGLAHLADALQKKLVMLFGNTAGSSWAFGRQFIDSETGYND